jgi:PAS domain S-box-containing protein
VSRDLTSKTEPHERGSDELFRRLVASVSDYAIFMLDPDGRIATWNIGAEQIKGYTADEIIGRHFSIFYEPEDVKARKFGRALEVATAEGRWEDTGWRLRKDGTRFWANVVITSVHDAAGALLGYAKITRDLSDRRKAEEEQLTRVAAEERFRLLIESVTDYAIFMLDPVGRVSTWNVGAQRIKGYRTDEILGRHFSVFYPADVAKGGKCEDELALATHEGRFEEEGWRVRKDGTHFWANVVLTAMRGRDGMLVGFAKVTRDLTERKRAQEEQAARVAAEQANRAKDEFLAMLGHELRNPMAPILTALELMKLRGSAAFTKEQEIIERQVSHMMHLVDDLLDVSRITRGKVELKREVIDVREVLAKAIEVASPLLEQRHQHLEIHAAAQPLPIDGDPPRLTQIFANLLTNAAKYTPVGGHIEVSVAGTAGQVTVAVKDDGIGIDAELLPRVFDLFEQGAQAADRSTGGLGIGLALVRSLTHAHGGRVRAESAGPGLGSCFTVELSLVESDQPAASAFTRDATPSHGATARILLVDDNEDARVLMADLLAAVGHDVRTAGDAAEALAVVKDFRPDVAILDIGLPVMDGYELAGRLREELTGRPASLVALTGYGQQQDRARSQEAGFDLHLVKPIEVPELLAAIDRLVAARAPHSA